MTTICSAVECTELIQVSFISRAMARQMSSLFSAPDSRSAHDACMPRFSGSPYCYISTVLRSVFYIYIPVLLIASCCGNI